MNAMPQPSAKARVWLAIGLACGAMALAGCDKSDNRTVGEKVDAGLAKTEQAADTAAAKTKDALADAKAGIERSSGSGESSMKQGVADTTNALKDAGASISAAVDDATITASVSAGLAKDTDLSAIKIHVETKGGAVVLTGPAPSAAAKARATDIAKAVNGVSAVDNQLDAKM